MPSARCACADREATGRRLGESRLLQAEREPVGARAEIPDFAEAAQRDECGSVIDFGETGDDDRTNLKLGRQRCLTLLRALGHCGRPDLDTIANAHAQGTRETGAQDDAAVVEVIEATAMDVLAGRLGGVRRIDTAHLRDAREVAIARERRAFGIGGSGGDLWASGELLRERFRPLDGRGASDLAVAEGFADAQAMFFAKTVHHRLHDE